jgi:hypothetical protein
MRALIVGADPSRFYTPPISYCLPTPEFAPLDVPPTLFTVVGAGVAPDHPNTQSVASAQR